MHSKSFTGDLIVHKNNYNQQFQKVHAVFKDDTSLLNAVNPKTIRQHNFLNLKADNSLSKNFLDQTSWDRFLETTTKRRYTDTNLSHPFRYLHQVENILTLNLKSGIALKDLGYNKILTPERLVSTLSNQFVAANINNDYDSLLYPHRKVTNLKFFEGYLDTLESIKNFNISDFAASTPLLRISTNFLEKITTNRQNLLHSNDQTVLSSDQTVRQYSNLTLPKAIPGRQTLALGLSDSTPYSVYNTLLRKNFNIDKSSS
jgi:hypothetical protein